MSVSKIFTFKKREIIGYLVILFIIFALTLLNYRQAYKRERDVQRNLDITEIAKGLEKYKTDFAVYPLSSPDGKIIACRGSETDIQRDSQGRGVVAEGANRPTLVNLVPCEWGNDSLNDVGDSNHPYYMDMLPQDPKQEEGFSYSYLSDGQRYYVLVAYETKSTIDYRKEILREKIECGENYCNAGRTIGAAIVEKI